jgi:hypothetical protein
MLSIVVTVWLVIDGTEDVGLLLFLGIPYLRRRRAHPRAAWSSFAPRLSTFGRAHRPDSRSGHPV